MDFIPFTDRPVFVCQPGSGIGASSIVLENYIYQSGLEGRRLVLTDNIVYSSSITCACGDQATLAFSILKCAKLPPLPCRPVCAIRFPQFLNGKSKQQQSHHASHQIAQPSIAAASHQRRRASHARNSRIGIHAHGEIIPPARVLTRLIEGLIGTRLTRSRVVEQQYTPDAHGHVRLARPPGPRAAVGPQVHLHGTPDSRHVQRRGVRGAAGLVESDVLARPVEAVFLVGRPGRGEGGGGGGAGDDGAGGEDGWVRGVVDGGVVGFFGQDFDVDFVGVILFGGASSASGGSSYRVLSSLGNGGRGWERNPHDTRRNLPPTLGPQTP